MRKHLIKDSHRIIREAEFFDSKVSHNNETFILQKINRTIDRAELFLKKSGITLDVKKKRVLDCGCGIGDLSIWLALQGALVTAIDVSSKSIELTKKYSEYYGVKDRVESLIMSLENLAFPNDTFDFVLGKWILHHVNIMETGHEIYRVLKNGGEAIFIENNSRNKLLMMARYLLVGRFGIPKKSDDIEYPLTPSEVKILKRIFGNQCKCIYPEFIFFRYVDEYICRQKIRVFSAILAATDKIIYYVMPFLRRYSYYQLLVLNKSKENNFHAEKGSKHITP